MCTYRLPDMIAALARDNAEPQADPADRDDDRHPTTPEESPR